MRCKRRRLLDRKSAHGGQGAVPVSCGFEFSLYPPLTPTPRRRISTAEPTSSGCALLTIIPVEDTLAIVTPTQSEAKEA